MVTRNNNMVIRASLTRLLVRGNSHLTSTISKNVLEPSTDVSQFSKARLVNHGELEDGEIPEPLKQSPQFHDSTLANGVRVFTEPQSSYLSHVTISVRACLLYTSPSPRDS